MGGPPANDLAASPRLVSLAPLIGILFSSLTFVIISTVALVVFIGAPIIAFFSTSDYTIFLIFSSCF